MERGSEGKGGRVEGFEDISRSTLDPFGINLGLIEFEANTEQGRFGACANLGRAPCWINTAADRCCMANLRY